MSSDRCRPVWIALLFLAGTTLAPAEEPVKSSVPDGPSLLGLPRGEFQARRRELMRRIRETTARGSTPARRGGAGRPLVVLRGADDPELEGKFRQTSDFAYLTGVELPSAFLVLDVEQDGEVLYLPPSSPFGPGLEAPRPGPGPETALLFGFQRVEPTNAFLGDLFTAIGDPFVSTRGRSRAVVYLRTAPEGAQGPEPKLARLLRDGAPATEFRDVRPILAAMRKVKSPGELEHLKRAIAITGSAFEDVVRRLRPGIHEYELEGAILGAFLANGSERPGFPSIVGSGPNATIPHYFANRRKAEDGELVVVDIGAEFCYYTADITRTYPVSGRFTARQRAVYELVLDAQKAVEAEMKPGQTRLSDMTRFTRAFFRNSPLRAQDQQGREQTMDHFFVHGLGHYLGMDVHDVGSYAEPVQVGEVFTIEPGLYIPGENLGVRIEDDYVMTEHGPEKISRDIPSDPDEIERLLAAARGGGAAGGPAP